MSIINHQLTSSSSVAIEDTDIIYNLQVASREAAKEVKAHSSLQSTLLESEFAITTNTDHILTSSGALSIGTASP